MNRYIAVKKSENKDCKIFVLYENEDCEKIKGFMECGEVDGNEVVFIHFLKDMMRSEFYEALTDELNRVSHG